MSLYQSLLYSEGKPEVGTEGWVYLLSNDSAGCLDGLFKPRKRRENASSL
jgi:hypothetical protein